MLASMFHAAINRLKETVSGTAPDPSLQYSSSFLEECRRTETAQRFAQALVERMHQIRRARLLLTDEQQASGARAATDVAILGVNNMAELLVALTTLVRGRFMGSLEVRLHPERCLVAGIAPDLSSGTAWHDDALQTIYLIEIDKALRILTGRGVNVASNLDPIPVERAAHRNRLQNTTPTLSPIPNHKATLASYSTDKPDFPGYDRDYPDPVTYSFNENGYRNDYEHNVEQPYSVLLGCSFVEGVGVAYEHTPAHQLSRLEGRNVFCLGCHGAGISFLYRSLLNHVAENPPPPARVYAVFTEIHRIDVPDTRFVFWNNAFTTFSAWSDESNMKYVAQVGIGFVYTSAFLTYTFLNEYCLAGGIGFSPVFYSYWNSAPEYHQYIYGEDVSSRLWGATFLDLARDRLHPGKREMTRLSQLLFKGAPSRERRVSRSIRNALEMISFRMKRREYLYK
jgi:hypothetical protein